MKGVIVQCVTISVALGVLFGVAWSARDYYDRKCLAAHGVLTTRFLDPAHGCIYQPGMLP